MLAGAGQSGALSRQQLKRRELSPRAAVRRLASTRITRCLQGPPGRAAVLPRATRAVVIIYIYIYVYIYSHIHIYTYMPQFCHVRRALLRHSECCCQHELQGELEWTDELRN